MKTRMFSKYIMTHHNKSAWRESGTQSRQGHSQNLKAVPQNFMEVFKVDDVTANDAIQKKQHLLRKEKLQISHNNHYSLICIFSIKLLKDSKFGFHFLGNNFSISILFRLKFVWLHSTIFELIKLLQICVYISIAVLFLTKRSQRTSS